MFPTLQIGPVAVQTSGLVILLGLWLGITIAEKFAVNFHFQANRLYDLFTVILVAGLLGARLAYVARYPQAFLASPGSLVSLNPGLLDPWGGVATAVVAALIYGQRKRLPFWPALDAATPVFLTLHVALGVANLASGRGFGLPTPLPWAIELWGATRHPSQIYDIFWALLILLVLWPGRTRLQLQTSGLYFLSFTILWAGGRLFLEAFRADSDLISENIRSMQVLAWFLLAASLWGFSVLRKTGALKIRSGSSGDQGSQLP